MFSVHRAPSYTMDEESFQFGFVIGVIAGVVILLVVGLMLLR